MFQAKPKLNQLKKYGNPKSRAVLHEQNIQLFGRQILEVSIHTKFVFKLMYNSIYCIIVKYDVIGL